MSGRSRRWSGLFGWVVAALLASPFARALDGQGAPPAGDPSPNVLLITVDALRADALGCYGRANSPTPSLDALAAQGALVQHCIASVPLGLPSHATILTGLQPFHHGVRDNFVFRLSSEFPTLAQRLSSAGYATAAEVGSSLLQRGFGLERGFATFHEPAPVVGAVESEERPIRRPASEVVDSAIAWLRTTAANRFFLWVNLADALAPYGAPRELEQSAGSAYHGAVAAADAQLGRLLAALDELKLADGTLVLVTGSHGEALGCLGEQTHGYFLSDDVLCVPLLARGPGIPAGKPIDTQVGLVDLAATILAACGQPPAECDGSNLMPLLTGKSAGSGTPVYSESLRPARQLGCSPLFSLRDGEWLYVRGGRDRLYARGAGSSGDEVAAAHADVVQKMRGQLDAILASAGPASMADASGSDPYQCFAPYQTLLASTAFDVDLERVERRLLRLIEEAPGKPLAAAARTALADALLARRRAPEAVEHYRAALAIQDDLRARRGLGRALLMDSKLGQASREYEQIVQTEPVLAVSRFEYALTLTQRDRYVEAIDQLQKAIELDPTYAFAQAQIGEVLMQMKLPTPALQAFEKAAQMDPADAQVRRRLVDALIEQKMAEGALQAAQAGVDQFPRDGASLGVLGHAFRAVGQLDAALDAFRRAAELAPRSGAAWLDLAEHYMSLRRYADAEKTYRQGIANVPAERMLHNGLAWLLATSPNEQQRNPAEAARMAEELTRATGGFDAQIVETLAAAKAALGDWPAAEKSMERAMTVAKRQRLQDYLLELDTRFMLYKSKKPFLLPPENKP